MTSTVCACGRRIEPQPDWAGRWITCPGCGGALYCPYPGSKPEAGSVPAAAPASPPEPTRLCPSCAETIPTADSRCRYCGRPAASPPIPVEARPMAEGPLPGDGMAALVIGIVGYTTFGLLSPVAWILGARYERECRRCGVAPGGAGHAGKIVGIVGTTFLLLNVLGTLIWLVCSCP